MSSSTRTFLTWLIAGLGATLVLTIVSVALSALGLHSIAIATGWVSMVVAVLIGIPAIALVAADARRTWIERRQERSVS